MHIKGVETILKSWFGDMVTGDCLQDFVKWSARILIGIKGVVFDISQICASLYTLKYSLSEKQKFKLKAHVTINTNKYLLLLSKQIFTSFSSRLF